MTAKTTVMVLAPFKCGHFQEARALNATVTLRRKIGNDHGRLDLPLSERLNPCPSFLKILRLPSVCSS